MRAWPNFVHSKGTITNSVCLRKPALLKIKDESKFWLS